MTELLLPLFPLNVVLYPETDLPLHIFEDRYKQMIGECIQHKSEFGVVLIENETLEDTGCSASVTRVVQRYDDGKMDILVRGRRRFELLLLNREQDCLRGAPQFFEDDAAAPIPDRSMRERALELFLRARKLLNLDEGDAGEDVPTASDDMLSYQIMARLPVELEFKQSLLPVRSEEVRLKLVIPYLEKLVVRLGMVVKARSSAFRNGHGR